MVRCAPDWGGITPSKWIGSQSGSWHVTHKLLSKATSCIEYTKGAKHTREQ